MVPRPNFFVRHSFLIDELLLGKLSETVVVIGNAPHDCPRFLVTHLVGNRASFLCTKAPMLRVPHECSGYHQPPAERAQPVRAGASQQSGAKRLFGPLRSAVR